MLPASHTRRRGHRTRGFTLAEVLVTVAIVAALSAIVIPSVITSITRADQPSIEGSFENVSKALTQFALDVKRFPGTPTSLTGLTLRTTQPRIYPSSGSAAVGAGTNFVAVDTVRYRGPYLPDEQTEIVLPLGFKLTHFRQRRAAPTAPTASEADFNDCTTTVNGVLALQTGTIALADVQRLEDQLGETRSGTAGIIRYNTPFTHSPVVCLAPLNASTY